MKAEAFARSLMYAMPPCNSDFTMVRDSFLDNERTVDHNLLGIFGFGHPIHVFGPGCPLVLFSDSGGLALCLQLLFAIGFDIPAQLSWIARVYVEGRFAFASITSTGVVRTLPAMARLA